MNNYTPPSYQSGNFDFFGSQQVSSDSSVIASRSTRDFRNDLPFVGNVDSLFAWGRVLAQSDIWALKVDPYGMLTTPTWAKAPPW